MSELAHDCKCQPHWTCLYVGRAVQVRNRLQVHAFGRSSNPPSPWLEELIDAPHGHMVTASIWYLPKTELLRVEAWLIDNFKPLHNKRDFGFSKPNDWVFRIPEVNGVDISMLEPDPHHRRNSARNTELRHDPGVYMWSYDPGVEKEVLEELLGQMTGLHLPKQPL